MSASGSRVFFFLGGGVDTVGLLLLLLLFGGFFLRCISTVWYMYTYIKMWSWLGGPFVSFSFWTLAFRFKNISSEPLSSTRNGWHWGAMQWIFEQEEPQHLNTLKVGKVLLDDGKPSRKNHGENHRSQRNGTVGFVQNGTAGGSFTFLKITGLFEGRVKIMGSNSKPKNWCVFGF